VAVTALIAPAADAEPSPDRSVVVLQLTGSIQPASRRYLERGLAEAGKRKAALVVLELNTPGGVLVSVREMAAAITAAAPAVAVYVTPAGARAASAGFFLFFLASDFAAMAPGTNYRRRSPGRARKARRRR
jgi:membrane-bound serine protease (ClpP class)